MKAPIRSIEELPGKMRKLVRMAARARTRAYAPYSNFLVGCALEDAEGKKHTGCNVENASFGATICAERVALMKMVSRGTRECTAVVVVTSSDEPCFPCGLCLQVIHEFGKRARIIAVDRKCSVFREAPLSSLFVSAFSGEQLKRSEAST